MNTMTTVEMKPSSTPDATGDCGDQDDPRRPIPDPDDRDPEEAGYGYGV